MKTITGTLNAYVTDYRMEKYLRELEAVKAGKGDENQLINAIEFTLTDMSSEGWTKIGRAEITVTFDDDDTVRENLVASLKAQKAEVLATAQAEATRIEERIQSLLAIEWDGKNA